MKFLFPIFTVSGPVLVLISPCLRAPFILLVTSWAFVAAFLTPMILFLNFSKADGVGFLAAAFFAALYAFTANLKLAAAFARLPPSLDAFKNALRAFSAGFVFAISTYFGRTKKFGTPGGPGLKTIDPDTVEMNIIKISDLSVSDIKFSDVRKNARGGKAVYLNHKAGGKIMLKLPALRAPFGLSTFTEEATGKVTSTSLPLSVDNAAVVDKLDEINKAVLDFVVEHCEEIMGKKMSRDSLTDQYKSPFKPATKEGYAPILNLKVISDPATGKVKTESYNSEGVDVPLDTLEKGQNVTTLVELSQIWRTPAGFGLTFRVHQVKFSAANKIPSRALVDDDDEQSVHTEYEEEDE